MEPSVNPSPLATDPQMPVCGELVVLNGRMSGARRAVSAPLTLIGQAPGCDVRLNVEGVRSLHCALLPGPAGLLLRDLGTAAGTVVNGEAVRTRLLREGDEIAVGPFLFRIEGLPPAAPCGPGELQAGENALRVQVAAVVAQQAELTEREADLDERRQALDRQQEELAGHLEQRRRQLEGLQEEVRQARRALKAEQEAAREEIEEQRKEAAREGQKAGHERRRLVELRKRLKRRWKRHWREHEARLRRWEEELAAGRADLEKAKERDAQARLRFNGEVELGRRQLREEWQELGLAQQRWEEVLHAEGSRRERERRALEGRARALAEGERALGRERRQWERTRANLRKECEGLLARAEHLRRKLQGQERALAGRGAALPPAWEAIPAPPADSPEVPAAIRQLADALGDQRLHLLEQWQRFLEQQAGWQHDRGSVVRDLEVLAEHLGRREHRLACEEERWDGRLAEAERRRQALEGREALLAAREAAWEAKREELLRDLRLREELLEAAAARLEAFHRERLRQRDEEARRLESARARVEQLRADYLALWERCEQAHAEMLQRQREVDGQALAVEQARQELVTGAADPVAADRRIARLRKDVRDRLLHRVHSYLVRGRRHLAAEAGRLARRAEETQRQEERLDAREKAWAEVRGDWEGRLHAAEQAEERRRVDLARLEKRHQADQRHLAALRAELDRLACALVEEAPAPAVSHAA